MTNLLEPLVDSKYSIARSLQVIASEENQEKLKLLKTSKGEVAASDKDATMGTGSK